MKPIVIYSDKLLDGVSWFFRVGGICLFPVIILGFPLKAGQFCFKKAAGHSFSVSYVDSENTNDSENTYNRPENYCRNSEPWQASFKENWPMLLAYHRAVLIATNKREREPTFTRNRVCGKPKRSIFGCAYSFLLGLISLA